MIHFGTCSINNNSPKAKEHIDAITLVKLFDETYNRILKVVPENCVERKNGKIWFKADDSLSRFRSKSVLESKIPYILQEFNNFLAFYFCFIKRYNTYTGEMRPIIKNYALYPYMDYYNMLKKMIDDFEEKLLHG